MFLTEAAEIEHNLLCSYLYAAFSLKRGVEKGVSATEGVAVTRWRKSVISVALEEMAHLALGNNLLVCVGGAAHFNRPNVPVPLGESLARMPASPEHPGVNAGLTFTSPRNVGPRVDPRLIAERLLELSAIHAGIVGGAANNPLPAAVDQLNRSLRS